MKASQILGETKKGDWTTLSAQFPIAWRQTARAVPDKIAVVDNHGASWTYAALDYAASRLANWLLSQG
ncbi:hypothetical protein MJI20_30280, partial [Salmonella enterica subsp. enterica serovar Anatum]|nr:hypothetical protein [Salmonella enterica subsp. enterica serovar Anatum]